MGRQRFFYFIAILCVMAQEAQAVKPYVPRNGDPVLESWRWHSYPELKGKGLRCLAEARDGAIWFGTNHGAWRYDGLTWTEYTVADGLHSVPVNAIYGASDGSVYAGTEMGIARFSDGAWRRLFPRAGDFPWPINRFTEGADGSLWVSTAWGALHIDGETVTCYTSADMATALAASMPDLECVVVPDRHLPAHAWEDGLGVKVVKGAYIGIYRGEVPMVVWALAPGGPAEEAGLQIGDRILAVDGALPNQPDAALSGVAGKAVELQVQRMGAPPFTANLETRSLPEGAVSGCAVSDILVDDSGQVWWALDWRGEVVRWSPDTGAWRVFGAADGLDALAWNAQLAQTADGAIWKMSADHAPPYVWEGERWREPVFTEIGGNTINNSLLVTRDGVLWVGCHGGSLDRLQDGEWIITLPEQTPMPQVRLADMAQTSDGSVWVAGLGQEAMRLEYDTGRWTTYLDVNLYAESSTGEQWFVNQHHDLIHFDGEQWWQYEEADGLMDDPQTVLITREDAVWVGGSHKGHAAISRLDPSAADGALWTLEVFPWLGETVNATCVLQASDGDLWFGSYGIGPKQLGGFLRFDGTEWRHYTGTQTLTHAYAISETADGAIWIGGGLRRYDGERWETVAEPVELQGWIHDMYATRDMGLWVGTRAYGVFRWDQGAWTRYGVKDGLADNYIESILEAEDGSVWVGTRKGVSRFDGHTWVEHALAPGIRTLSGGGLDRTRDGALWIWWLDYSIRYRPDTDPPETRLDFFFDEVTPPGNNTFAWTGNDRWRLTPTEELRFSWRLDGGAWSPYSRDRSKVLTGLAPGEHVFEVVARDLDFNSDPTPAVARFVVLPPVWRQAWFLGLIGALGLTILSSAGYALRKRRDLRRAELALIREMEDELQTAHDLQMGLMPVEAPEIEGLDLAGSCLPASQVGGDFFQYYHGNGTLKLCIADVTGHAMGAAIPVVMFSGVLESEVKHDKHLDELFTDLNRTLCKTLDRYTFVCFAVAELELASGRLQVANSGCPYPMHYRATESEVVELELDAYPLGLQPTEEYPVMETRLEAGDYLVFCSDGIVEALDERDEPFGFERTQDVVREAGRAGLSAGAVHDRLLAAVRTFSGAVQQEDDITCVVLRVTG